MNERIDHSNYEAWLLDRLEGRLSPEQDRLLGAFLLAHPHLAPEGDLLPSIEAISASLGSSDREALKRALPPTGMVDRSTLQDHLIALHERDLTPEQTHALEEYLLAHPEARREERIMAHARIARAGVAHPDREQLRRVLPPAGLPALGDLNDFLVARLEGDLDTTQEHALARILSQDESARKSWALISATRIAPEAVVYEGKAELKRSGKVIAIGAAVWVRRMAAAASIALLLSLGWMWLRSGEVSAPEMAQGPSTTKVPTKGAIGASADAQGQESPFPDAIVDTLQRSSVKDLQVSPHRVIEPQMPVKHEPVPQPEFVPIESPVAEEPDGLQEHPLVAESPVQAEESMAVADGSLAQATVATGTVPKLGQVLTGVMRERVLAMDPEPARPLDAADAEAAASRALRAMSGDRVGFALQRDAKGQSKGFDLRLGRHVALSARR
ncbi:MAG TPA: hypothetical protein PKY96_00910 [Flavobacteriales bacterium]|nr:hypothetical protein [Flavobacteriales bacterium]